MPRDPSRKSKRKRPSTVEIDEDLGELASVLDEHRRGSNIAGWLSIPWRSGWCAASLPLGLWYRVPSSLKRGEAIASLLRLAIAERKSVTETYNAADDFKTQAAETFVHGDNYSPLLMATARCVQIEIANSSGGGIVYNDVLRIALEGLDRKELLVDLEICMLEARCRDAIGTTVSLLNDKYDRRRRAFAIAWNRGLFHAAYSIKPIGDL